MSKPIQSEASIEPQVTEPAPPKNRTPYKGALIGASLALVGTLLLSELATSEGQVPGEKTAAQVELGYHQDAFSAYIHKFTDRSLPAVVKIVTLPDSGAETSSGGIRVTFGRCSEDYQVDVTDGGKAMVTNPEGDDPFTISDGATPIGRLPQTEESLLRQLPPLCAVTSQQQDLYK